MQSLQKRKKWLAVSLTLNFGESRLTECYNTFYKAVNTWENRRLMHRPE